MAIYNPYIMTNTNGTEHNSDLRSELFCKKRVIFIDNEINSDLATAIVSQMMFLNEQSSDDIYLLIDSPGGAVSAGYRIHDYIKYACRCDVVTVASGTAASMGAFLLAAGTKGKRYATQNSEIMIHQPLSGAQGQATEMMIAVNRILKIKQKLTKILAEACGKDFDTASEDMERDYWMSSEEAKEYGIVDCIGFPEELKEV